MTPNNTSKLQETNDSKNIYTDVEIYHIGASLKDLGKKWFALILAGLHGFSKFESDSFGLAERLKGL